LERIIADVAFSDAIRTITGSAEAGKDSMLG
jgi:hypothetical protein